jgi:signal transduction histidine kinase
MIRMTTTTLTRVNRDEIGRLARAVSHDLSQPLTTVVGFTHLLITRYGDELGTAGLEWLESIASAGSRMQGAIDELVAALR